MSEISGSIALTVIFVNLKQTGELVKPLENVTMPKLYLSDLFWGASFYPRHTHRERAPWRNGEMSL